MNVVLQLVDVYFKEEWWHESRMSEADAVKYHATLLSKGRIIPSLDETGLLLGYVETWRIDFTQFGRLLCREPFSAEVEDVEHGNICYLANTWVRADRRDGAVLRYLRGKVFRQNLDCTHFAGHALRKQANLVKVFKRQDAFKLWADKENSNERVSHGVI